MKFIKTVVIGFLLLSVFSGCKDKDRFAKLYINNNSEEVARVAFAHKNNKANPMMEIILNPDETAKIGRYYYRDFETDFSWNYVKVFFGDNLAYECVLDSPDMASILNYDYYSPMHPKAKEAGGEVADLFRWCGDALCKYQPIYMGCQFFLRQCGKFLEDI